MRRVAAALAGLLLLSGCWSGGPFYSPADARPVIPAGDYRMLMQISGEADLVRISVRGDGMTRVYFPERPGEPAHLGFAPLDERGRRFAVFAEPPRSVPNAPAILGTYALLVPEDGGAFRVQSIYCDGTEQLAIESGATVTRGPLGADCSFPTRDSLETALRRLDLDSPALTMTGWRLEPVAP